MYEANTNLRLILGHLQCSAGCQGLLSLSDYLGSKLFWLSLLINNCNLLFVCIGTRQPLRNKF